MLDDAAAPLDANLGDGSVPALAPGVRLRRDRPRDRWVLLAPERVVVPDATCLAVLRRIDGRTPLEAIVGALHAEHDAPRETIHRDVTELIDRLRRRGWVRLR